MNKDNATFSEYEQNKGSFQKVYAKKIWNFPYVKRGKVREALKKNVETYGKFHMLGGGQFFYVITKDFYCILSHFRHFFSLYTI